MIAEEIAEKNTIIRVLAGSHIHGLNVETSDRDEEAIIVEPIEQMVGLEKPFEELIRESPERDVKWVSLRKWCHLALKGNPNFLLPLFAPRSHILKEDARGSQLRDMADKFISKLTVRSHLGYMQGQRNRLTNHQREWKQGSHLSNNSEGVAAKFGAGGGHGKPRFDLIDKFGFDTKFGMHLIRLGMQGCELLETGKLTLPIDEERRKLLMAVRNGDVNLEWVLRMADDLEVKMKDGVGNSKLPEKPDYAEVERFMVLTYFRQWSADRAHKDRMEDAEIFRRNLVGGPFVVGETP